MGTMERQLDAKIEEELAKQTFSFHRLRLAYQRALESRKSSNNKHLKASSVITMAAHSMDLQALFNSSDMRSTWRRARSLHTGRTVRG
jgi:hypothetical protein